MRSRNLVSPDQWKQFQLFGFLVLRGRLTPEETSALRDEVEGCMRAALGDRYDERPWMSGMAGHYVPLLNPCAPVTCQLVEDVRFHATARDLLDGECLISPADTHGTLYFGEAPWHNDVGYDLPTLKFVAYLDSLTAANGALRVLPLSHRLPVGTLESYVGHPRVDIDDLPGFICDTDPGDVIAFDGKLFHATKGGRDRLQWSVTYVRDETEHGTTEANRRALADWFAEGPTWDEAPFPPGTTWLSPAWHSDREPSPVKQRWLDRFMQLGVKPSVE